MARIIFRSVPFNKSDVTMALESGADGVIVPGERADMVAGLSRCQVIRDEDVAFAPIGSKTDEEDFLKRLRAGEKLVLAEGWEIIPVENLLAQSDAIMAEAANAERAKLAAGILERGVAAVVIPGAAIGELKKIVADCKTARENMNLAVAKITRVERAGLGHRVCLDTMSILRRGQGMLVGNSSAFTFLVHAETERNEYVAARPFRVNAGAVHAYVILPENRSAYLGELKAGDELLAVDADGKTSVVTLGRVKIEIRPMLLIEAEIATGDEKIKGSIFLQNAETIRLTAPGGIPVSVVALKPGDEVLCRLDQPGRHFGMAVKEDIREL
ncbi:MAG: 3-dehydroquinate synthase II family protein [Desulfovibrio sp.]|nr:3-dehydroquinate synthase II family protein [Desulfovibrio sp.]